MAGDLNLFSFSGFVFGCFGREDDGGFLVSMTGDLKSSSFRLVGSRS